MVELCSIEVYLKLGNAFMGLKCVGQLLVMKLRLSQNTLGDFPIIRHGIHLKFGIDIH